VELEPYHYYVSLLSDDEDEEDMQTAIQASLHESQYVLHS